MLIVSAGVIMNVIFAAVGFMAIFMIGYPIPPATVGSVIANSPAARAATADGTLVGLQPGDVIVKYDGKEMAGDFSRILLNVALTHEGERIAIVVKHPDGAEQTLYATPAKPGLDGKGLLQLGVGQPFEMAGPEVIPDDDTDNALLAKTELPDLSMLKSGDRITQIAGQSVNANGEAAIAQLYAAMNASDGKPIDLTIESPGGKLRHETFTPHFAEPFASSDLNILGMVPRQSGRNVRHLPSPGQAQAGRRDSGGRCRNRSLAEPHVPGDSRDAFGGGRQATESGPDGAGPGPNQAPARRGPYAVPHSQKRRTDGAGNFDGRR